MFRALLTNTLISGGAYLFTAIVGVLLVPVLVSSYGLAGLGFIVLARVFLPTGILGFFDLGYVEVTSQAVARARVSGNWDAVSRQLTLLSLLALASAIALGALVFTTAKAAASVLVADAGYGENFTGVVQATAVSLSLLLPALVWEGVLRGFESYRLLRLCEVTCTIAYAAGTLVIVANTWSAELVAFCYLGSQLLKAGALGALVMHKKAFRMAMWTEHDRSDIARRCKLMFHNRALGALQTQSAPLMIGGLVGTAGVGAYDVLIRIPRLAKLIIGLLTSALIPVAARLDEAKDQRGMRQLGIGGVTLIACTVWPPLAALAVFSSVILDAWVGPDVSRFWIWQALMFIVPALGAITSFGGAALTVRSDVLSRLNRVGSIQIALQLGLSIACVGLFEERAFILGQVVATALAFFFQARIIFHAQDIPAWTALRLAKAAGLLATAIAVTQFIGLPGPSTLPGVLGALVIWTTTCWIVLAFIGFTPTERNRVLQELRALF